LDFYFFKFQPSEFLKIFFIVFFASFFTKAEKKLNQRLNFVKAIFYFSIPFLLIFKQPDLGNALVYGYIFLVMYIFSPVPKKYFFYLGILFLSISPLLWRILKPYQQQRIISFIKPEESYSSSYHMTQSIITVGSGMFSGRGLGFGTQTKLLFLPESTTDFAFASLIEQFGFFLGFVVIVLYFYLIFKTLKKAFDKNNHFNHEKEIFYYRIGFASFLFFQVLVNIGMSLGILPIAGITLPLISYGGSSILTLMFGLSLL
jgi:rod shape determining protein RodA